MPESRLNAQSGGSSGHHDSLSILGSTSFTPPYDCVQGVQRHLTDPEFTGHLLDIRRDASGLTVLLYVHTASPQAEGPCPHAGRSALEVRVTWTDKLAPPAFLIGKLSAGGRNDSGKLSATHRLAIKQGNPER